MTNNRQHFYGTAIIAAAISTAGFFMAGCGTYNSWTPRESEPDARYSCADGYYNCDLRTSNQAGDNGKASRGAK